MNTRKQWKDVVQYRTAERGDTIFALDVPAAIARHATEPAKVEKKEGEPEKQPDLTPGARALATMPLRVDDLVTSPDGTKLVFVTQRHQRAPGEIRRRRNLCRCDVARTLPSAPAESGSTASSQPRRLTHNEGEEVRPRWANDSRHILFSIGVGDVSGPYRDLQPHLYWVNVDDGKIEQWDKAFVGPVEHYAVTGDNVLTSARLGTESQIYDAAKPADKLHRLTNWPGTYANISTTQPSPKVAFVYSSLGKPEEIYLADSADKLDQARPITSFNKKLRRRAISRKASPTSGRPTTAPRSKAC